MSKRVFYAVTSVIFCGRSTPNGFQSVSLNSNVDLEPIFSLGQLALYDIIGGNSEFEMSAEASVDGGNFWSGAGGGAGGEAGVLAVGANDGISGSLGFGTEDEPGGSTTGFIQLTNGALTSHGVNLPLDGPSTENVTVVFRGASSGGAGTWVQGTTPTQSYFKVFTRKDFTPAGLVSATAGITFNREDLFQFGQQGSVQKVVNYPAETSMEKEFLAKQSATSSLVFSDGYAAPSFGSQTIYGGKTCTIMAALVGVSYSGGDTGGGNGTYTESYAGYNNYSYS